MLNIEVLLLASCVLPHVVQAQTTCGGKLMRSKEKARSKVVAPFYLEDVLETDLSKDVLCRIGPLQSAEVKDRDVVFTAPLMRQKSLADRRFFNNDKAVGTAYIRLRLYGDNIVRIRISQEDTDFDDDTPMLQMDPTVSAAACQLAEKSNTWRVSDATTARFIAGEQHFAPSIFPDSVTEVQFQDADYFFTEYWDALATLLLSRADGSVTIGFSLRIDGNEHFCGTGERFHRIDLFGRQIDLVNENAHGLNTQRSYKNIPFLLSSRPYGVFVHSTAKMKLDVGAHSSRSLQWLVEDDVLDIFFVGGGSFQRIIQNYQKLTGFPSMPPLWSFGSWMSRCTYESDAQVTSIAERLRREKYPMDILHIDTGWFKTEWKCDWTFSQERFPDPPDFFKRMRQKGFRISLWEYPYVSRDLEISKTALANNYVGEPTEPDTAVEWGDTIDFTNPAAVSWYKGLLKRLLQMGAVTFKTDFAENIDEYARYQNIDAQKYRNLFSLLYQKATWEAIDEVTGEPFNWARSGWAGAQKYPVHWSADCSSTFDGVINSLWGGLHLGLSGFAFWSHDIGGFYAIEDVMKVKPTEELYMRWTQHGVFSSHMRYHGMTPREPWEYPHVADLVREWLRLRYALLPYILAQSQQCCANGLPFLRALVFDWTDDPAVWTVSDQYLFGDAFMICPVFNPAGVRNVYLPEGDWVDFWSGGMITGPVHLKHVESGLSRMPIYLRFDAEVEFAEPVQCTDELAGARRFTIRFNAKYKGFNASELRRHVNI
jgi:alpha-D-xyloside xylohydrolase